MEKLKILLDTDLGSDCDDAGALALLHRFADAERVEILGIPHCISELSATITIQEINEWYHRAEIPVGRYDRKPFWEGDRFRRYSGVIMKEYLKQHEMPVFENAVRLMRRILAEHEGVTLITIGHFNNLAELLQSEPDDISSLTGKELFQKSVKEMYAMAGNFADFTDAEYNVKLDCESAQYVTENIPCPIAYCGFELGEHIKTGENLMRQSEENPVKKSYMTHRRKGIRESWDPITVYCAIEKNSDFFEKSTPKSIAFRPDGTLHCEDGGKDCYLIKKKDDSEIKDEINQWLY